MIAVSSRQQFACLTCKCTLQPFQDGIWLHSAMHANSARLDRKQHSAHSYSDKAAQPLPAEPTAMVVASSRQAIACSGLPGLAEAATRLERRSSSSSCPSNPVEAKTCEPVKKATEVAAACRGHQEVHHEMLSSIASEQCCCTEHNQGQDGMSGTLSV